MRDDVTVMIDNDPLVHIAQLVRVGVGPSASQAQIGHTACGLRLQTGHDDDDRRDGLKDKGWTQSKVVTDLPTCMLCLAGAHP